MQAAFSAAAAEAPAPTTARVVHRTRGRLRLRLPSRRYDLPFFMQLYDNLRRQPEIDEVTINPTTGSVLVWYAPEDADGIDQALTRGGRLRIVAADPPGTPPGTPRGNQPAADHAFHMGITDMRIILFVLMAGVSAHQLIKGQLLAPVLTMLLYLVDLAAGIRLEQRAMRNNSDESEMG